MTIAEDFTPYCNGSLPPIAITFMLTCYFSPEPAIQLGVQWNSEAGCKMRNWLMRNNLIDAEYSATERGKAWVDFICSTPLPIVRWALPERSQDFAPVAAEDAK